MKFPHPRQRPRCSINDSMGISSIDDNLLSQILHDERAPPHHARPETLRSATTFTKEAKQAPRIAPIENKTKFTFSLQCSALVHKSLPYVCEQHVLSVHQSLSGVLSLACFCHHPHRFRSILREVNLY